LRDMTRLAWHKTLEAFPVLVTLGVSVVSMNIASGLAAGMICHVIVYGLASRWQDIHLSSYILTLVLLVYLVFYS